jgi:hypothetical protein
MMATAIGVVITPDKTTLFHKGDGVYQTEDNDPTEIDENNTPSYLAYGLFPELRPDDPKFEIDEVWDTATTNRILVGSDGLSAFIHSPEHIAHADQPLGDLNQFFDPLFMEGDDFIQRRLLSCGPWRGRQPQRNPLFDDTSLIRIQRRPVAE